MSTLLADPTVLVVLATLTTFFGGTAVWLGVALGCVLKRRNAGSKGNERSRELGLEVPLTGDGKQSKIGNQNLTNGDKIGLAILGGLVIIGTVVVGVVLGLTSPQPLFTRTQGSYAQYPNGVNGGVGHNHPGGYPNHPMNEGNLNVLNDPRNNLNNQPLSDPGFQTEGLAHLNHLRSSSSRSAISSSRKQANKRAQGKKNTKPTALPKDYDRFISALTDNMGAKSGNYFQTVSSYHTACRQDNMLLTASPQSSEKAIQVEPPPSYKRTMPLSSALSASAAWWIYNKPARNKDGQAVCHNSVHSGNNERRMQFNAMLKSLRNNPDVKVEPGEEEMKTSTPGENLFVSDCKTSTGQPSTSCFEGLTFEDHVKRAIKHWDNEKYGYIWDTGLDVHEYNAGITDRINAKSSTPQRPKPYSSTGHWSAIIWQRAQKIMRVGCAVRVEKKCGMVSVICHYSYIQDGFGPPILGAPTTSVQMPASAKPFLPQAAGTEGLAEEYGVANAVKNFVDPKEDWQTGDVDKSVLKLWKTKKLAVAWDPSQGLVTRIPSLDNPGVYQVVVMRSALSRKRVLRDPFVKGKSHAVGWRTLHRAVCEKYKEDPTELCSVPADRATYCGQEVSSICGFSN